MTLAIVTQVIYTQTYRFILLGPSSRGECSLMNTDTVGAKFTPYPLISYHMEEQNDNTLQGM